MSEGRRWYVVHTHPHAEDKAAFNLARQGFETYLPKYLKTRRHARRTERVARPLFPRYLFVALDLAAQPWRAIQSSFGVAHLICRGDRPASVAPGIVEGLRRRQDAQGLVRLQPQSRLKAGDRVKILDGAFASCLGLYEGLADSERVAILLDLLGRKVRVVLDAEAIEAVA